jgi:hypothetical protein
MISGLHFNYNSNDATTRQLQETKFRYSHQFLCVAALSPFC